MSDTTRRAVVAERAARAGGAVAREQFRTDLDVESKADKNDLVTATDREAQEQVVTTLREAFPADALVCEEDALPPGVTDVEIRESVPETEAAWVVDPIDGTANFVRELRFWTTSVAAVVDGETVGAATYLPAEEDIYASGPEGATRNGSPMAVSERTDPETFAVGLLGWWPMGRGEEHAALFRASAERFGDLRRMGSMQGMLALVAAGGLDAAYMPARPHPWDSLAGVHMIREAGGRVTDRHGEPWERDSEGLVVSNGQAHDAVLEAMGEDGSG
ncbi:inositol monophosphatase [Halobacteriales archaeon SW_10_68_16]|jgi:myo-inositol-1(or 4)-monophosphatase|nr:MAG: inositol monophosphatase [Halobacteriales archaeon SW_10_68_16]